MSMNEVKESLRGVEQKYKLFQQQQFTFIAALEHCRENAHDKIRPISSIGQVVLCWGPVCRSWTLADRGLGLTQPGPLAEKMTWRPGVGALVPVRTQILIDGTSPSFILY